MSKHEHAGQMGTVRLRKSDGGYRAVAVNESKRGLWMVGDELFNRQFHPFPKGEEFNAVVRISDTGRKMVQKVESLTGATLPPAKTRSKKGQVATVAPVWSNDDAAIIAGIMKQWREKHANNTAAMPGSVQEVIAKMGLADTTVGKAMGEILTEDTMLRVSEEEEQMTKQTKPRKSKTAPTPTTGYYIAPDLRLAFNKAYRMSHNKPERAVKLMMVGPSGYGKTTIPRLFAEMVGATYMRMDCAKVRDPEEWFGYREAIDGSTVFIRSNFAKALERGNLVVTMDEFNRLEPWIHNSLFPLLDDDGRTVVHDEEFIIGPNVWVVGTINLGYKYTGTFELDEALMNRFDFFLEVGPMEHREEVKVLVERTGIHKADAEELVRMANRLREQEVICSTRTTLQVAEKNVAGMTLRQAFEYTVVRRIPNDATGNSLRKSVVDSINTHLGSFEVAAIENDVFEMGAAAVQEDAPLQLKEFATLHYLELRSNSNSLSTLHLIGAIRQLPLVSKLTMNQARELAEQVREGQVIQLNLSEKPEDFEAMARKFNSMGVGGKYRSVTV